MPTHSATRADSQSDARIPRFIMGAVCCALEYHPDQNCHFQIAWSINPHMIPGASNLTLARQQHAHFKQTLIDAGAEITELPFVCQAYDSVFVKDNALLLEDRAVLAIPVHEVRRTEQQARKVSLLSCGFKVLELPFQTRLEGGDLVVAGSDGIFLGHGFRSTSASAAALSHAAKRPVITLELVDPYLYHLDTALSLLKDGTAIACREAFSRESWACLESSPWISKIIEVSRREALSFGCNIVQVGNTIIMGSFLPRLMRAFKAEGYLPRYTPLSEFQRAGGSAACLVAEIHSEVRGRVTTSPTAASLSISEYG